MQDSILYIYIFYKLEFFGVKRSIKHKFKWRNNFLKNKIIYRIAYRISAISINIKFACD